jgi:hypothetical protein
MRGDLPGLILLILSVPCYYALRWWRRGNAPEFDDALGAAFMVAFAMVGAWLAWLIVARIFHF